MFIFSQFPRQEVQYQVVNMFGWWLQLSFWLTDGHLLAIFWYSREGKRERESCSLSSPPSVQFSHSVMSDSLQLRGLQHARPPCPSPTPRVYSNSCPSCQWCHPTILPSAVPISSCLKSFPASGSFPMSQLFTSGGQSIGISASASVLPMNIQDWFPLGLIGWISLQSKRLSRVFSNFTKMQFCGTILDLLGQNIWVMGLGSNFEK